jgi:t-SNARE complex subunit (syntaxin)
MADLLTRHTDERALAARNRRTARWLVAWIVFLVLVSVAVIWVRN